MALKKIGVLGSGVVGKALAAGFVKHGYPVMIGSRDPHKLEEWHSSHQEARTGNFQEAAEYGEMVVLAVKGTVAKDVLRDVKHHIKGKIVIDATNPIADAAPEQGLIKFFTNLNQSLMEQLQKEYPEARFVKAFNIITSSLMVNPDFQGIKPTMFICGNDTEAKKEVVDILNRFGFESEDMGGALSARAIEPMCILFCIPGLQRNEWMHAFKLLKQEPQLA